MILIKWSIYALIILFTIKLLNKIFNKDSIVSKAGGFIESIAVAITANIIVMSMLGVLFKIIGG